MRLLSSLRILGQIEDKIIEPDIVLLEENLKTERIPFAKQFYEPAVFHPYKLLSPDMGCKIISHDFIYGPHAVKTSSETLPILTFRLTPLNFRHGIHTRIHHIFPVPQLGRSQRSLRQSGEKAGLP